ncbi:MAG: 16S rRNA (guanine(527)-N(7))-methyltransferase RsmG [Candidatus Acidiferrales bacterium]
MAKRHNIELSSGTIVSALRPFGVTPSAQQIDSIRRYLDVLLLWNEKVGLTTLSDPEEIVARHFGESLFCTRFVRLERGRLADIGSGGGFPGLAIKVMCQDLELFLVESNKKKAVFLAEVVRTLEVGHVEIIAMRFEDWRPEAGSLDFITSRALGHYPFLMRWAHETLKPSGKLILWLGDEEGTRVQTRPGWRWRVPERIPLSRQRQLLVGSPESTAMDGMFHVEHS